MHGLSANDLHLECDAKSQTLSDFAHQLATRDIIPEDFCEGGELCFVDLLEMREDFRGLGFGKLVLSKVLNHLSDIHGVTRALYEPVPLQFNLPFRFENATPEERVEFRDSLAKLRLYYRENFGAQEFEPDSAYMWQPVPSP